MIFGFLETHDDFLFLVKTQWFSQPKRILQAFPCKMLIVWLNLEFPGADFFDGEGGHQTFRKRTFLGGEGVEGGAKSGQRPTPRWASWWPQVAFL